MMKAMINALFAFFIFTATGSAQDLKAAKNALNRYNLDQTNKASLSEAVQYIKDDPAAANAGPEFYLLRGDIYTAVATQIITTKQLGIGSLSDLPNVDMVAIKAFNAYNNVLAKSETQNPPKLYEIKDALKGLQETENNLYNFGIYAYEEKNYEAACQYFETVLKTSGILKKNGQASALENKEVLLDQKYITGLAAMNAGLNDKATAYFEELYKSGYDKPAVYEALYTLKSGNTADELNKAYLILQEGRKKYPDDASLLFAEINHFLKLNKPGLLIDKLKLAIAKEPNNVSLLSTLANVFDNLYQEEAGKGNKQKADEYFSEALKYYNQALLKDPANFDARYGIGALHYNKAALLTQELNELSSDFTAEGIKKYEVKKAQVFSIFDNALPHFQKAEQLDPNDVNTLIALREIFIRKDDRATAAKMDDRLKRVQAGHRNESSFFK